ncbi:hypothetical protein TNCV_3309481 [Trichonephila clavipes]|nr:hypothetical protein TNCV_3309481 [Trichonephila clavipes]
MPPLHACTRDCSTADASSWTHGNASKITQNNEDTVLDVVQNNSVASMSAIVHAGNAHMTFFWILHTNDKHSYHPHMHPYCTFNVLFS